MMESLRGTLFRLRPPDIEELGLAASLEALVAGWNGRCCGEPFFVARLSGDDLPVPAGIGGNIYRVAQEALTNAAKHAAASRVTLNLCVRKMPSGRAETGQCLEIELVVKDDGRAVDRDAAFRPGLGLLGMRERVSSIGGRLSFVHDDRGSVLRVLVPAELPESAAAEPQLPAQTAVCTV